MHHITGFAHDEIVDICVRITAIELGPEDPRWPSTFGLFNSAVATLAYKRGNLAQAAIGEWMRVSQSTIHRAIKAITPLIQRALGESIPKADDLDPEEQFILDGTLLPCWSWKGRQDLYSGKHKDTGMNVQVACNIYGQISWVSDPVPGSRHDNYCQKESSVLDGVNPDDWFADKGYQGSGIVTPFKKPKGGELLVWQKEFNSAINKFRWKVEQVISNLKNWRIISTGYRRPIATFPETITAVVALHFYRMR
jgi:hypothetical protein